MQSCPGVRDLSFQTGSGLPLGYCSLADKEEAGDWVKQRKMRLPNRPNRAGPDAVLSFPWLLIVQVVERRPREGK